MLSKLTRGVCLLLGVTHAGLAALALRGGDWRGGAEGIATVLLAVVMWFAMPPGAKSWRLPRFGTRGLRVAVYCAALALALVASIPIGGGPAPRLGATGGSAILLLAVGLVAPFLGAEREGRETL